MTASVRRNGDYLGVGEVVIVQLKMTKKDDLVMQFVMCNNNGCNKIEVWGLTDDMDFSYRTWVDCSSDSYKGRKQADVCAIIVRIFECSRNTFMSLFGHQKAVP